MVPDAKPVLQIIIIKTYIFYFLKELNNITFSVTWRPIDCVGEILIGQHSLKEHETIL